MNAERGPIGASAVATKARSVSVMSSPRLEKKSIIAGPKFSSRESSPRRTGTLKIKGLGAFTPPRESSRQEQSVKNFTPDRFRPFSLPESPKAVIPRSTPFANEWFSPTNQKSRGNEKVSSSFNKQNKEKIFATTKKVDSTFLATQENKIPFNKWNTTESLKIKQVREALREIANSKTVVPDVVVKKISVNNVTEFKPQVQESMKKKILIGGEFTGTLPPLKKLPTDQKQQISESENFRLPRYKLSLPKNDFVDSIVKKLSIPKITLRQIPEIKSVKKKEAKVAPVTVQIDEKKIPRLLTEKPKQAALVEVSQWSEKETIKTHVTVKPLESLSPVKQQLEINQIIKTQQLPLTISKIRVDTPNIQRITTEALTSTKKQIEFADLVGKEPTVNKDKKEENNNKSPETVIFKIRERQEQEEICFAEELNPLVDLSEIFNTGVLGRERKRKRVVAQGVVSEGRADMSYKPLQLTGHVSETVICKDCVKMLEEQRRTLTV